MTPKQQAKVGKVMKEFKAGAALTKPETPSLLAALPSMPLGECVLAAQ